VLGYRERTRWAERYSPPVGNTMTESHQGMPHDDIDPVTLVHARYPPDGARWLALPCEPWDVPRDIFDDDNVAFAWYENAGIQSFGGRYGGLTAAVPVGTGSTPSEAYEDLVRRVSAMQPFRTFPTGASGPSARASDYHLLWPDGQTTIVSCYNAS